MPEKDRTPARAGAADGTPQGEPILQAFVDFLDSLRGGGSIPFTVRTSFPSEEERRTMQDMNDRLVGRRQVPRPRYQDACLRPLSVAFPPCADVLLSLIRTEEKDEVTDHFKDYFTFCDHSTIIDEQRLDGVISQELLDCTKKSFPVEVSSCDDSFDDVIGDRQGGDLCPDFPYAQTRPPRWPPTWCLPPACVTLRGTRHLYQDPTHDFPAPIGHVKRLFMADLVWLFYFERMGVFQILGRILDEYAYSGGLPISNGAISSNIVDDVNAIVLEAMVRQTEAGTSSKVRDRDSSYRRCLNWTSEGGRKLGMSTSVNAAFNNLFHKFIANALEYYKDKRLAVAIQGVTAPVAKTSVATLITLSDTISLLKKSFDSFDYGRNYVNTLSGIVWTIAAMSLVRNLRQTLGIPPEYEQPYEYIPAAYDILVLRRPITPSETNRYEVHRQCANGARNILLDLEVLDHTQSDPGGELERWLSVIESKIEGYRTAYRSLSGIDLAMPGTPVIEHQAV